MSKFKEGDRVVSPVTIYGPEPEGYALGVVLEVCADKMYILEESDGDISEAHEDDMILASEFTGTYYESYEALEQELSKKGRV